MASMEKPLVIGIVLVICCTAAESLFSPPGYSLEWSSRNCPGGDNALLSTGLWLRYNSTFINDSNTLNSESLRTETYSSQIWINYNSILGELKYYDGPGPVNLTSVKYSFIQREHGGGSCHCVNIFGDELFMRYK